MAVNFTDTIYVFTPGVVGVESTRTSQPIDISKRDNIALIFTASSITSGNGVFTVDVSNDNSYWVTGIAVQSAKTVGVSTTPGQTSVTSSTNRNVGYIIDPSGWSYMRVKVTVATDGRYNCIVHSQG